jgi:hypothetical protein
MSVKEGGGEFVDYRNPKKLFKTTNPDEWDKHLRETDATVSGTAPCAICAKPVTFENIKYTAKPVCDSCKQEMR